MDTKPTSTLAKLHVSQGKYDYALAIYLYLQAKEGKSYRDEITEAMIAICETRWGDYDKQIKNIFSKEEIASFHIVPDDLQLATAETLNDIQNDFEGTIPQLTEIIKEEPKLEEPEKTGELEVEEAPEPDIEEEIADNPETETVPDEPDEVDADAERIEFPTLGDAVYEEPEIKLPKKEVPVNKEELVPGLDDFTNNYKKEVKQGLTEDNSYSDDENLEKKLQDDIDQKLFNVLRIMRGMSAEELRRVLNKKLGEGTKLEELTLGDLEELLD
ncbi:MAG: hypothetical protein K9M99_10800 [Candidatus Cloacimonetes bacterium]|nr:hypothetical protein [Candidatus Cloacimonadota bacterium]